MSAPKTDTESTPEFTYVPLNRIAGHRALIGRRIVEVTESRWLGLSRGSILTLADGTEETYFGTRIKRLDATQ